MRWSYPWLVAAWALGLSCGGPARGPAFGLPQPARTSAVLVGELCAAGEPCACRDLSAPGTGGVSSPDERESHVPAQEPPSGADAPRALDDDGVPAATAPPADAPLSAKRLEIRLRSSHALWLRLGPWTFAKDRERPESCYYIDVPAGDAGTYAGELRASNRDGVEAGITISELGAAARTWYRTLSWSCGAPGACSFEELDARKREAARQVAEHRLYDPCGSLQISDLRWDARVAPDHEFPGDLTLQFSLRTTARVPEAPAGDQRCAF